MKAFDALRSCKYLYLHQLAEPNEGELLLIVYEAVAGDRPSVGTLTAETHLELRRILEESAVIEHQSGSRVFSIRWASYIGYAVLNESFVSRKPETSVAVGRLLVEYSKSTYLDYITRATFATSDYPGPFKHWGVHCLNHIVDVVSCDEPEIEVTHAA